MPAENQIILPTPVTKVRSIWPVLSNDKVKVKIRPLNKIVAHRGSETFEITSPSAQYVDVEHHGSSFVGGIQQ